MTSKVIEVRAGAQSERTFIVTVTSTLEGYSAHVAERLSEQIVVPVALHRALREEVSPSTFYQFREHYRQELLESVKCDVLTCRVTRKEGDVGSADDAYIRANLRGWPEGYSGAVSDDLSNWEPTAD